MSLKLAAEGLCVTSTAVSHKIRVLEDHLSGKLFFCLARSLAPTGEETVYAPLVRDVFDKLDLIKVGLVLLVLIH